MRQPNLLVLYLRKDTLVHFNIFIRRGLKLSHLILEKGVWSKCLSFKREKAKNSDKKYPKTLSKGKKIGRNFIS